MRLCGVLVSRRWPSAVLGVLGVLSTLPGCSPRTGSDQTGAVGPGAPGQPPATSLTTSSCIGGSGPDTDGDGYCDSVDTCVTMFNPDQVDLDFDGLGDPCDLAPADPLNTAFSPTDASMVVDPLLLTLLTTPDGGATLEFEAGAVTSPATLTIVQVLEDASVDARGEVDGIPATLVHYRLYVGGQGYYVFQGGQSAVLTVGLSADVPDVSLTFRNHTLAVWTLEDTNGDGLEDIETEKANCLGTPAPPAGNCSSTEVVDGDGDLTADTVRVAAPLSAICCNSGVDLDMDGFGVGEGDCNDGDAAVYPGATEVCDFKDNDCNFIVDDVSAGQGSVYYVDGDGDGHGDVNQPVNACSAPAGTVSTSGDCNDADASFYPGAPELCSGRDNDCDGNDNEGTACFDVSLVDVGVFGN